MNDEAVLETSTMLAVDARSCGQARRFVEQVLDTWRAPADLVSDACLVVTELVSNAIGHGSGPIGLRVTQSAEDVVVEVTDCAPELPVLRPRDTYSERGRGLLLVSHVSTAWGTRRVDNGAKVVWARLDLLCDRFAAHDRQ